MTIFLVLGYMFVVYMYISVIVVFYAIYKKRDLDKKPIFGVKFLNIYFFLMGSWVGIGLFCYFGFEKVFFFIPNEWGSYDEIGEWTSTGNKFSSTSAGLLSLWIIYLLDKKMQNFKE